MRTFSHIQLISLLALVFGGCQAESDEEQTPTPEPTPMSGQSGLWDPQPRVYFDPGAVVETVAGSGSAGTEYALVVYSEPVCSNTGGKWGDGGEARRAQLSWPTGVAVDKDGVILIADQCNNAVRAVKPNGQISTLVRYGHTSLRPDGRFSLRGPGGVEVSAQGNRYIVDTFSHTLLKQDNTGLAWVLVGERDVNDYAEYAYPVAQETALLNYPTGVAEDSQGRLYIANYWSSNILKVENGSVVNLNLGVTYAGGIATDSRDQLYVTDNERHRVLKVDSAGEVTVIAGIGTRGSFGDGGLATQAQLHFPTGVRVRDDGVVFITDTFNHRVVAISQDGKLYTVVGNGALLDSVDPEFGRFAGDNGPIEGVSLNQPYALDFDLDGNLLIADAMNNRIRRVRFSTAGQAK